MMARALKIASALVLFMALGGVGILRRPGWKPVQMGRHGSFPAGAQEPQNAIPSEDMRDATVRQLFHLSLKARPCECISRNAFGTETLHVTSVHVARPLSPASRPAIDPAMDKAVTFAGSVDVTIPPGAEFVSDPVDYPVAALSDSL